MTDTEHPIEALKALKALEVEALASLRDRPGTERAVDSAMRDFLAYSLDRSPRSLAFPDEVRRAAPIG